MTRRDPRLTEREPRDYEAEAITRDMNDEAREEWARERVAEEMYEREVGWL